MRSNYYDMDFRDRAGKTRTWGLVLLALAAILWIWCAMLLMLPYEADTTDCKAPLFTERGTANTGEAGSDCAKERDWPEVLAVLGASVPVSVVGGSLFAIGTVSRRMSAHAQAIRELDELAEKPKS
ncbi:hypothetical protein OG379_12495 [Streptomyces sp. NBC_01166]|uniref:hypothetical protein n=1 Tax=Streptomyces sp. NBC_01166 TaxID=2903755 RepID=UPI00386D9727|nr:hypothetical protein OG379_12495 [Streptomyces sp. NBC_01166]